MGTRSRLERRQVRSKKRIGARDGKGQI